MSGAVSLREVRSKVPVEVVDYLERALDAAKEGKLAYCVALLGVDEDPDGSAALPVYFTRENDNYRALGLCSLLEHQIRRVTAFTTEESS